MHTRMVFDGDVGTVGCLCVGVKTGACVNSTLEPGAKVCEIYAWCPVERDDNTTR